jgi:flagellar biosynthesis/type III secretory pathway M-ring protein FliF/YscJ
VTQNSNLKKMKQILEEIKKNKFQITVGAFIAAVLVIIFILLNALQKNRSYQKAFEQIEALEKEREKLIEEREVWSEAIERSAALTQALYEKDKKLQRDYDRTQSKLDQYTKKHNEKVKDIRNYSSSDIYKYYRDLPAPETASDYFR